MDVATMPPAELTITREIRAPRARVFAAWTEVSQAALWWAPKGLALIECAIELRPGGGWRRRMRGQDGGVILKHGVYREIVPPERLVFTYNTEYPDGRTDPETLVTLTFAEQRDRTQLTLRHTGFLAEPMAADHRVGWTSALQRFAEFVAAG